jgi:uncharacterized protein YdeI (BOF family)
MNAPFLGSLVLAADCKLAGVERGLALIDYESKGGIDKPTETTVGQAAMTVQGMTITQKGRLTFDLSRNMISSADSSGQIAMDMTLSAPNGQKVATSTKQNVQTKISIKPTAAGNILAPAGGGPAPAK